MKILLINNTCKYSSTGKICYDLYNHLNADGHQAYIAYGRGDEINEPGIYKFGIDSETKMHALKARVTGKNACYSPKSTKRLLDYIEEIKPDLVHIHEIHAYFVNRGELLAYLKEKQIQIVWTFHCEYMYTGKCGFSYGCDGYKSGCGNCPYKSRYIGSWFLDKTAQLLEEKKQEMEGLNIKAIISPSKWLADKTKETYLYQYNIGVINNGIDTNGLFYPREDDGSLRAVYNIPEDKTLVLAVAPKIIKDPRKGGQMVLDLAATMPDTYFVLVGDDKTRKYSDNVQIIARTKDQDELARWYSLADLFIICSEAENFPTTCIEALCCGTAIVGLDSCGTKETAPAPYGTFVKADMAGDEDVKYAATLELLQQAINVQLLKEIPSAEIREYAVRHYDRSVMYKNYLEIYKA